MKSNNTNIKEKGFTIVELLVVIVVIGILASITVVSYIGIIQKASEITLASDLANSKIQLMMYRSIYDSYPTALDADNCPVLPESDSKYCLKVSAGNTYSGYESDGDNFSIIATNSSGVIYFVTDDQSPRVYVAAVSDSFAVAWGGGEGHNSADSIVQTSDGGYVIAGGTESYGAGERDAYIARYTSDGTLSWSRTWGGVDRDYASSLVQASDGGFVMTGYTYSYGSGGDVFLAKYTSDGTLSWSRTWGGSNGETPYSIIKTSDEGYAISGQTRSYSSSYDAFVAKYTSDGTLSWSRTWGRTGFEAAYSLVQTSDGGYAIAGETNSFGGYIEAFIAKYTSDGTLSWNRTWGGAERDYAYSIIQTSDGGYAIAGDTASFGVGNINAFIAKYTSDGTLSWNRTWGGTNGDYANSIIQTSDGGYVIAGEVSSYGADYDNIFLAKYTIDGLLSWSQTWSGGGSDDAYSLIQTSDGGYAIAGRATVKGYYQALIIKYDSSGLISNCPLAMCQSSIATSTSPLATVTSPNATVASPTASTSAPIVVSGTPDAVSVLLFPTPDPDLVFTSEELYVAWAGNNTRTCKTWSASGGNTIKSFYVTQETELYSDNFIVSADGLEVYNYYGVYTDKFVDISATPAVTLEACLETNESIQEGFGGEVTGIVY